MRDAVIYARYSSHNQREESIEGQLRICHQYAKAHDLRVIREYYDEAKTGRSDNREQFQKMLRDAENHQFDCVLIYARDRFARNKYEDTINKHKLDKNNIQLVSVTQPITDDPEGVLMESLLVGLAEYYSLNLSRTIKRGMQENLLKGKTNGGSIPIGYRSVNGTYELDPLYAPVIEEIYRKALDNETLKNICESLNERKIRTPKGNKFNKTTIASILSNKKYTGVYTYGDIEKEGMIPQIITKETFEKVQERFKKPSGHYKAKAEYLLYGKLFCGKKHKMTGESATGRNQKYYYYKCKCLRVKKESIEELVVNSAIKLFADKETVHRAAVKVAENYNNDSETEIYRNQLQKRLNEANRKINNLVEALANSSSKAIVAKIDQLEQEAEEIKKELAYQPAPLKIEDIEMYLNYLTSNQSEGYQKKIIDVLVNKVIIQDDHVIIVFNISDNNGKFKELTIDDIDSFLDTMVENGVLKTKYLIIQNKLILYIKL